MQKPGRIRYYITKSGEEPTVRSVRVALGADEPRAEPEATTSTAETDVSNRRVPEPAAAVKRRVKDAIRRRMAED